jgi:hypothetical protein
MEENKYLIVFTIPFSLFYLARIHRILGHHGDLAVMEKRSSVLCGKIRDSTLIGCYEEQMFTACKIAIKLPCVIFFLLLPISLIEILSYVRGTDSKLVGRYFGGSLFSALQYLFPEFPWFPWKFKHEPKGNKPQVTILPIRYMEYSGK